MNHELLEEILSCPSLPSLPAVAVEVVELTNDPNVSLDQLARTIQNDQALSAKVLRTVNSSFYGLRTRCATIGKALVMLGLSPVKTLTLGFSLVSTLHDDKDPRFDHTAYWRRGLFSGVGARCVAEVARLKVGDEAFLGGLLQDIGMMAMYRALGDRYLAVLEATRGDHRLLVKAELDALELQHPEIGAMLAKRWKLPDELVLPIRYHERPTAAPNEHSAIVRLVGLGNMIHDVLTDADPSEALRRYYQKGTDWFKLTSDDCEAALKRAGEATKELSTLFRIDTGARPDVDALLERASAQMTTITRSTQGSGTPPAGVDVLVMGGSNDDPLTGLVGRLGFDAAMKAAMVSAKASGESLTMVEIVLEGVRTGMQTGGEAAGDEAIVGAAALARKHFEPSGAICCRLGVDVFAAIIVGATSTAVRNACAEYIADVARSRGMWAGEAIPASSLRASIGMAIFDPKEPGFPTGVQEVVLAATKGVQAARAAGADCVREPAPAKKAA